VYSVGFRCFPSGICQSGRNNEVCTCKATSTSAEWDCRNTYIGLSDVCPGHCGS
jgi:hypothetical protein